MRHIIPYMHNIHFCYQVTILFNGSLKRVAATLHYTANQLVVISHAMRQHFNSTHICIFLIDTKIGHELGYWLIVCYYMEFKIGKLMLAGSVYRNLLLDQLIHNYWLVPQGFCGEWIFFEENIKNKCLGNFFSKPEFWKAKLSLLFFPFPCPVKYDFFDMKKWTQNIAFQFNQRRGWFRETLGKVFAISMERKPHVNYLVAKLLDRYWRESCDMIFDRVTLKLKRFGYSIQKVKCIEFLY